MNSSTGGTTKDGGIIGILKEAKNALGGETTSHNCYGVGTIECDREGLLKEGKPLNWEPVYPSHKTNNTNKLNLNKNIEME